MAETWTEFTARVGADPLTWAREFQRINSQPDAAGPDMVVWFGHAIEAGRAAAGPVVPEPKPQPDDVHHYSRGFPISNAEHNWDSLPDPPAGPVVALPEPEEQP